MLETTALTPGQLSLVLSASLQITPMRFMVWGSCLWMQASLHQRLNISSRL